MRCVIKMPLDLMKMYDAFRKVVLCGALFCVSKRVWTQTWESIMSLRQQVARQWENMHFGPQGNFSLQYNEWPLGKVRSKSIIAYNAHQTDSSQAAPCVMDMNSLNEKDNPNPPRQHGAYSNCGLTHS